MANPRLPAMKADVSGAALKNPQRHRDRKAPANRPLGEPYARMTDDQKVAWQEFADELPWLTASHRALLQVACLLRARMNADPEIGVTALSAYSAILSKLAATPVDDTKVALGGEEETDPSDQFFSRPH